MWLFIFHSLQWYFNIKFLLKYFICLSNSSKSRDSKIWTVIFKIEMHLICRNLWIRNFAQSWCGSYFLMQIFCLSATVFWGRIKCNYILYNDWPLTGPCAMCIRIISSVVDRKDSVGRIEQQNLKWYMVFLLGPDNLFELVL